MTEAPFYYRVTADGLVPILLGVITETGIDYGAGAPPPTGPVHARLHGARVVAVAHDPGPDPDPDPAAARLHRATVLALPYVAPPVVAVARLHQGHVLGTAHVPTVPPAAGRLHSAHAQATGQSVPPAEGRLHHGHVQAGPALD